MVLEIFSIIINFIWAVFNIKFDIGNNLIISIWDITVYIIILVAVYNFITQRNKLFGSTNGKGSYSKKDRPQRINKKVN